MLLLFQKETKPHLHHNQRSRSCESFWPTMYSIKNPDEKPAGNPKVFYIISRLINMHMNQLLRRYKTNQPFIEVVLFLTVPELALYIAFQPDKIKVLYPADLFFFHLVFHLAVVYQAYQRMLWFGQPANGVKIIYRVNGIKLTIFHNEDLRAAAVLVLPPVLPVVH